jgi:hypothetical protein
MTQPVPKRKIKYTGTSIYQYDFIVNSPPGTCLQRLQHMAASNNQLTLHVPVEFDGGARFVLHYYEKDRKRVTIKGVFRRWEGTKTGVHCNRKIHETWLVSLGITMTALVLLTLCPVMFLMSVIYPEVAPLAFSITPGLLIAGIFMSKMTPFDDVPPNILAELKTALRTPLRTENTHPQERKLTRGGMTTYHTTRRRGWHRKLKK